MANQPTIPEMIQIGDVSGPLAALYTGKKAMFGKSIIKPIPPLQITIFTDILRWGYDGGAETDQTLRKISNYLYWMCGMFQLQAQNIISGPGGGSVVPTPSGGAAVNDLDFIVSATSYIATGESAVTFDGTGGMPDLRGYNVDFARNGTTQYTTPQAGGALYYSWNSVTGLFQLLGTSPEALEGESFRIMPDATGGSGSSSAYSPTTISLSADGTYTLPEGYLIWKISILPTVADTVKIGTTLAGDDIMFDKLMTINVYGTNGATVDVYAESADKIIYFTGFTGQATINIYLLPI